MPVECSGNMPVTNNARDEKETKTSENEETRAQTSRRKRRKRQFQHRDGSESVNNMIRKHVKDKNTRNEERCKPRRTCCHIIIDEGEGARNSKNRPEGSFAKS